MKDAASIAKIAELHPLFQNRCQSFIEGAEAELGITLRIVQGMRTFAQQQAIYDQGRTTPGTVVTKAKAGQSYHNYGLAVDVVPFTADGKSLDWEYPFQKLVPFASKYGLTWGGTFPSPDRDHFEDKMGYNWRDLLAKYQQKDFIEGTQFVKL